MSEEQEPMRVYLPRGFDDDVWQESREAWLQELVRRDAIGNGTVEFYVADVLASLEVTIESDGEVTCAIPEGTNHIVMIVDGEVADQGDTLAELVARSRDGAYELPIEAELYCWRHHKQVVACTFSTEEIASARAQNAREDAEAAAEMEAWRAKPASLSAPAEHAGDQS
jgi:hypothetical protein